MNLVLANSNPIHEALEQRFRDKYGGTVINKKEDLNEEVLSNLAPKYVFFPHWSYIIPANIYENFECVVFHMTDLPYGRGGSPLQNLIVRGHEKTMVSALKVGAGIDTGDLYLKEELSLLGTAEEVFLRLGVVIEKMMGFIIKNEPALTPQTGEIVNFKRRKPAQGDLSDLESLKDIFNYIRMLDAEGYPNAFFETEHFRFEFSRASLKKNKVLADVRIIEK